MTPQEKINEIEERLSGQLARCIGGSFSAIQFARMHFSENAAEDISWLISRVAQLEKALIHVRDRGENDVHIWKNCATLREALEKMP